LSRSARTASHALAQRAPGIVGSTWSFLATLLLTVGWIVEGAVVGFTDSWLLIPSAIASIAALLLVVLLQYSQNRDTRVIQLKLDELIRGLGDARTHLVSLEHVSDDELAKIEQEFRRLREEQEAETT
jgi:low affinity Fe/Cu permease